MKHVSITAEPSPAAHRQGRRPARAFVYRFAASDVDPTTRAGRMCVRVGPLARQGRPRPTAVARGAQITFRIVSRSRVANARRALYVSR
jgi:hypothetical protein